MKRALLLINMGIILCFVCAYFRPKEEVRSLPRLYVEGNIDAMEEKWDVRNVTIRYENGAQSFEGYAQLKVQGTSSLWYDKKNYTIKLFKDVYCTEKLKVNMGWGAESKYCLKANWVDKTHARNIVTARLLSQMNERYGLYQNTPNYGAVDGFPIEVYCNGSFWGLYTWNIPKDEWMLGMDKENPNHVVFFSRDWEASNMFNDYATYDTWSIEVGEESLENLEKLNRVLDFVMNCPDEDFREEFPNYMSLDSALNYYILADVSYLADNVGKNVMMVTYDGSLWYPTLYDMDLSWGEYYTLDLCDYENETLVLRGNRLWKRIEDHYSEELAARYEELRKGILSEEHIMELFHEFENAIPPEVFEKERERWGDDIPGYDLSQIEHYLEHGLPLLDQKYASMKQN